MKNDVISSKASILSALKLMDKIKRKLLFVIDDGLFIGVLSVGDIQRAIINQKSLDLPIYNILRKLITIATPEQSYDEIRQTMLEKRTEAMPIVDSDGVLQRIIYWDDIIGNDSYTDKPNLGVPVVIMAGGEGSRLKPLTNVIPKPLMPIGDKTILEEIMNRFDSYGCNQFYVSVNYKAEMISYYFENLTKRKYDVTFFKEEKPLGTAGSLNLLNNTIKDTFFVSNCDILIDEDYSEILKYHNENNNELTVVAAIKSYKIPYGTIETKEDGILKTITEKPEITFKINTGFYILEPELIKEIPDNTFFHITTLIEKLQLEDRRIGVFPVSENSWKDIGEWKEYLKLINE